MTKTISEKLSAMSSDYEILYSRNFTDNEAKVFIDKFKVDIKTLEKRVDVANNPHILQSSARSYILWQKVTMCVGKILIAHKIL